jgi:hypothetical protein
MLGHTCHTPLAKTKYVRNPVSMEEENFSFHSNTKKKKKKKEKEFMHKCISSLNQINTSTLQY